MKPEHWTRGVLAALVAAFLWLAAPKQAAAQAVCGERARIVERLADKYAERPVARGLANTGAVFELFASPGGTWTLVVTPPTGPSCMVAAGARWRTLTGPHPSGIPVRFIRPASADRPGPGSDPGHG